MDNKGNNQWVWLALDADTREIVGVYIGSRDEAAARKLWEFLPGVYRHCAIAYTDFWAAYGAILPSKRHPCGWERNRQNLLCGTIQQHTLTACFPVSAENVVVLEIIVKSYWCDLVFCSCLQRIITSVGLPKLEGGIKQMRLPLCCLEHIACDSH